MPSSVTHSYFSVDVYNRIDKNIKNKLKNNIEDLKTFSQGPDPYFFYDFHLTKRSKEIYKINYSNGQVMTYLYGHICHFVLDTTIHPLTIYNTGVYDKKINILCYTHNIIGR